MTHFDFKTLLPALLQVEDRVSMAHGLESRVPFLDHRIVELAATIPADIKFENGNMKHVLRTAMRSKLPERIFNRQDKMGFPVPLHEWLTSPGPVRDFVRDVFSSQRRSYSGAHRQQPGAQEARQREPVRTPGVGSAEPRVVAAVVP